MRLVGLGLSALVTACTPTPQVLPSPPLNPLAGIPPLTHPRPPERSVSRHDFWCGERGRYRVVVERRRVDPPEIWRSTVRVVETPYGSVPAGDQRQLDAALSPYGLVFSVSAECQDENFTLIVNGRQRSEADNSTLHAWFRRNRISRIGP